MITLKNIFLRINKKKIFNDLSLEFSKKGISVILGPNGSGKTLLTKVILGLVNLDKGMIKVYSKNKIKLGYSPQKITFLRRNVFDNIAFPMILDGCDKSIIKKSVNDLLKKFGIFEIKNLSARNLSGGLGQFVSFVRSIVGEPEILILDEPSSNLDINLKNRMEDYLMSQRHKRKVIMVTHDLFQAQRLADEIILVENGVILMKLSKKEFINAKSNKIKSFLNKNYY
jgi:ABC-type sugar transport system ATPase subunit|tara:strand:+ start:425 stop:1105 length:681 start_codon:yes stop_codon:yes gene_type:complete